MDEDNANYAEDEDRPTTRKIKKDELELFNERIKEGKCKYWMTSTNWMK